MFCRFCGNKLPDDAKFCTKCGKVTSQEEEVETKEEKTSYDYAYDYNPFEERTDDQKKKKGSSILKFAIIALAFADTCYFAFIGIIFSIIAKVKLKKYTAEYKTTEGVATVGKHLSTVALILSIVLTVVSVFIILELFGDFTFLTDITDSSPSDGGISV